MIKLTRVHTSHKLKFAEETKLFRRVGSYDNTDTTKTEENLRLLFTFNYKGSEQCGIAGLKVNKIIGLMKRNIEYKEKCLSPYYINI